MKDLSLAMKLVVFSQYQDLDRLKTISYPNLSLKVLDNEIKDNLHILATNAKLFFEPADREKICLADIYILLYLNFDLQTDVICLKDRVIFKYRDRSGNPKYTRDQVERGLEQAILNHDEGGVIEYGLYFSMIRDWFKTWCLSLACKGGRLDLVKYLIDLGANVIGNDFQPIKTSIRLNQVEVIHHLLTIPEVEQWYLKNVQLG